MEDEHQRLEDEEEVVEELEGVELHLHHHVERHQQQQHSLV